MKKKKNVAEIYQQSLEAAATIENGKHLYNVISACLRLASFSLLNASNLNVLIDPANRAFFNLEGIDFWRSIPDKRQLLRSE